ncbi:MAG TPA: SufD family Fe-S cluster assembly protein [Candidatus Babeliales bacterium]|nr:SufD family Fe-S cluster assembly protein [Candidatus Babeliales bacterium]
MIYDIVCEYKVGENQHKNYFFLIETASADQHIRFYVERNAKLTVEMLIASTINVHLECILVGEGAHADITGAYMLGALQKVQITTLQHHVVPHTQSTLLLKGLLRDSAHAQYHGTVRIEKDAQGSCASQENKNILLSNNARAISVPSLEVLTHDVRCSHGSAIGRFDDEQLFYAASRGIDEKRAQQLFANAFLSDLFTDEMLKKQVYKLLG